MTQIDFGNCCQGATKVLLAKQWQNPITVGGSNGESAETTFGWRVSTPTGALDPTFGTGGKVRTSFGDLNGGANGAVFSPMEDCGCRFQATARAVRDFALAPTLDAEGLPLPTPTPLHATQL